MPGMKLIYSLKTVNLPLKTKVNALAIIIMIDTRMSVYEKLKDILYDCENKKK